MSVEVQQESVPAAVELRTFIEEAPTAIAMFDLEMCYIAASTRWRTDFALVDTPVIGRCHYDLLPDLPERWKAVHRRCLAGVVERHDEDLFERADGTRRWWRWEVRPWRTARREIGGITIFTEEVTARVEAYLARVDSEERLRLALDAASAGAWTWDVASDIVTADERFSRRFAFESGHTAPREHVLGRIHPDDRERVLATMQSVREPSGRDGWDIEYRVPLPEQTDQWMQSIARVTRDASGAAIRVGGITLDITSRKSAECEIVRSHAELAIYAAELEGRTTQLQRLASDLTLAEQRTRERLATLLHNDLQQLLFSVRLQLERLVRSLPEPSALDRARKDLEDAITAARSFSVELFPPGLREAGLPGGLAWLADWFGRKYKMTVTLEVDPRCNPVEEDVRVLVFESVRELLFNAVKHAGVDRVSLTAALDASGHLHITVADEGAGFDVIRRFHRGSAPGGLGLFSIRERLHLLGGRIDIESEPGHGARFTLIVPGISASRSR